MKALILFLLVACLSACSDEDLPGCYHWEYDGFLIPDVVCIFYDHEEIMLPMYEVIEGSILEYPEAKVCVDRALSNDNIITYGEYDRVVGCINLMVIQSGTKDIRKRLGG